MKFVSLMTVCLVTTPAFAADKKALVEAGVAGGVSAVSTTVGYAAVSDANRFLPAASDNEAKAAFELRGLAKPLVENSGSQPISDEMIAKVEKSKVAAHKVFRIEGELKGLEAASLRLRLLAQGYVEQADAKGNHFVKKELSPAEHQAESRKIRLRPRPIPVLIRVEDPSGREAKNTDLKQRRIGEGKVLIDAVGQPEDVLRAMQKSGIELSRVEHVASPEMIKRADGALKSAKVNRAKFQVGRALGKSALGVGALAGGFAAGRLTKTYLTIMPEDSIVEFREEAPETPAAPAAEEAAAVIP